MATKGFDAFRRELVRQVKKESICIWQMDGEKVEFVSNGTFAVDLSVLRLETVELDYLLTEARANAVRRNGAMPDMSERVYDPVVQSNVVLAKDVGLRIHKGKGVYVPLIPKDNQGVIYVDTEPLKVFDKAARVLGQKDLKYWVKHAPEDRPYSPVLVSTSANQNLGVLMPINPSHIGQSILRAARALGEQVTA